MTSNTIDYSDLIPEYQQGLLDPEVKALFEWELECNEELRGGLDDFVQFQQCYQEVDGDEPQVDDKHFDAILSAIDLAEGKQRATSQTSKPESSIATRVLEFWAWVKDSVSIPWGVALIQTAAIILLMLPGNNQESFKTLSRTPGTESVLPALSFNIVFQKSAREEEIRKLLLSIGGSITSGPSARGLYIVALSSDKAANQAVEILNNSGIVTFSERSY